MNDSTICLANNYCFNFPYGGKVFQILENVYNFQELNPMNKTDMPEESSWTFYFEEFLLQNEQEMVMSCDETLNSCVHYSRSSIAKKASFFKDDQAKKVRFKKRKTKGIVIDDSLEDTASSPLSSPKVSSYIDQAKIKNKNKNKKTLLVSEKVGTYEEENTRMVGSNMELKKRGLCLVPLSSLANYLS
ncbi:LOW QUALITY PROTEIN: vascular-related unknown protein 4-like [Rutidosis leptorrhynchoides]|uniref:LOW QUALITY PROTEIN: vascular-related unknown protein 4-like n=1 Tax=Rutidosis leptorrhynchoides TaxID=125765 RepID=UPI003A98ECD4